MVLLMSDVVEAGVICNGRLLQGRVGNAGAARSRHRRARRACRARAEGSAASRRTCRPSALEEETNRPLRRAPASVIERTGMMIGRAVASAVAVFDLRLVLLTGAVPRRSAAPAGGRAGASSTSAADSATCGPAPTAPSTASSWTSRASPPRRRSSGGGAGPLGRRAAAAAS